MPEPATPELQALTRDVMLGLDKAAKDEDFTELFETLPAASQALFSAGMLQQAHQKLIDDKVDVSDVATVDAIFNGPPDMKEYGAKMYVNGYYPVAAGDLRFKPQFIHTDDIWRLHRFFAKIVEEGG